MRSEHYFATPIFIQEENEWDLEEYCLRMSNTEESERFTNVGGFQSRKDIHKDPEMKDLVEYLEHWSGLKTQNAWINVNGKDSYNRSHVHPGARIACVYYPRGGSSIKFHDPRSIIKMIEPNEVVTIEPEDRMLICFPAWLEHEVLPNESDKPRISIAVNLG